MAEHAKRDVFRLKIPLDASGIEDLEPDQTVKVAIRRRDGSIEEQIVKLSGKGEAAARFGFAEQPGAVRVAIGPADASAQELFNMQTITADVSTRRWLDRRELLLPPIKIAPYYWHWWRRWCRTFVIRGRVICPDGNPVPAARVCAYDVDWWFFWNSTQMVGCDTTDINGAFEIKFRWCCGFWPWWWWLRRVWRLDPDLLKRIGPVLQRDPRLRLGRIGNQPSLAVLGSLLGETGVAPKQLLGPDDANVLEQMRPRLLAKLPPAPELEALHIWPWWPWRPWRDCTPDIIFKVTQDCEAPGTVILDETIDQVRWNIDNPLDVVLEANDQARCVPVCPDPPCEPEECLVIQRVCGHGIDTIGGNLGHLAGPVGYLHPGLTVPGTAAYDGDRPFGGTVLVEKNYGDMLNVDYYEIEHSADGGLTWNPLPGGAAADFYRYWMDMLPGYPTGHVLFQWVDMQEPAPELTTHRVVQSRERYEELNPAALWDAQRYWMVYRDLVVPLASAQFADGTYHFRIVGWQEDGGQLTNRRVLHFCNTQDDNYLVLTFDNRLNPDPAHPTSATHPCGANTIHLCVTEPDTDFIAVRIDGTPVEPCQVVNRVAEQTLEIDFLVDDPDGHLAVFSLLATYGENLAVDLLAEPGSVLTVIGADYKGPTYGQALGQGAVAPHWYGGTMRLTIPVSQAFPEPCCYQLELRAWKRTVVDCDHYNYQQSNLSQYTIGVGACPPLPQVVEVLQP